MDRQNNPEGARRRLPSGKSPAEIGDDSNKPLSMRDGQCDAAPQGLWNRYQSALSKRPLQTKMITSGVIAVIGDVISQRMAAGADLPGAPFLNYQRLFLYAAVGLTYVPVATHYWFNFLNRLVNSPQVSKHVNGKYSSALFMLLLDQTVGTIVMNAGFFIVHAVFVAAFNGTLFPLSGVARTAEMKLRSEIGPVMAMNWKIWPAANFVNFSFVPLEMRVLFSNVVAIFWNSFLSAKVNK